MKPIDLVLILLILGAGGFFLLQKNGAGNCRNGQIQLTAEIKARIDSELASLTTSGGGPGGLQDLMARTAVAEKKLDEVIGLGKENSQIFKSQIDLVLQLKKRKQFFAREQEEYADKLEKQALAACLKRKPPKL